MNPITATSLSGLRAAQTSLGVAAHNIANAGTEGFRRQTVQASTAAPAGVSTSLGQATAQGPALETDLVATLRAKNEFLANLQVFKTSDQMIGSLLDLRG